MLVSTPSTPDPVWMTDGTGFVGSDGPNPGTDVVGGADWGDRGPRENVAVMILPLLLLGLLIVRLLLLFPNERGELDTLLGAVLRTGDDVIFVSDWELGVLATMKDVVALVASSCL